MKAKKLRIVLPMLTAIMILGGCGQVNTTQQDILNMLNTSDTVTIELTVEKDENEGYKYSVDWIQLGDMTSSKELRAVMDEQFKITGNTGNKNGMFYVNEKGENTQNNTLSVVMKNRAFTTILNNADDLELINYALAENYSDIDIEDERAIYAAISDYFELLNAGENGESNIEDSLSRAEAMSLVFRAVTPVSEIEGNSAFDNAVGQSDYNAFANKENENVYVSTSDGSLNETTYIQNMTKAEYIYLVMNEVFGNQAVQSVDSSVELIGLKNAGNLRYSEELVDRQQVSSAIIKSFVNNPTSIDENIYKALELADQKGIISSVDDMDSAITKGEAVEILCKALMQNPSIEEFNYNMGSINTDYEYVEPESVETIESTEAELSEEEITYINSDDYNTTEEVTEPVNEQPEQTVADYEVEPMTGTMYATQSVNVRQEPTVDSSKVGSKSYAEKVEVTGKVTSYKGESCSWYQTSDGTYISGNYLTDTKPAVTTNKTSTGNTNNSNSTSTPSNNNNNSSNNNGTAQGGISQDVWDAFFSDNGGQSTDGGQASAEGGTSNGRIN